MNKLFILLLLLLPLSLIGQVESQFNGTLNVFSGTRIGSTNTFTISGIFNSTTTSYTSANSATGDIVQVQSGARFYWLHIYSIASNSGGVITCNVRDSSSTLTVFPTGKWSIFRPTPNLRLPLSPDGESNASRSATFNTLALRVDEIQSAVSSATNCEQTITKTAHGFRKWTPIFWNGSTYTRPTADSIVPDYIVVDSLTANTFKVASCGTYTTTLSNGLYWYTNVSPGYSLTPDTTKVPLFQVLNTKLILDPIVGFNLMSGSGGTGIIDGDKGDITVSSSGATWTIDNGVITTIKLEDDAVTSAKIGTAQVGSDEIASSGVTAGSYTNSNITVDADGRVTMASNGSGGGGISGLTTNRIPVAGSSTSILDGLFLQDGNGVTLDALKDFIGDTFKIKTTSTYATTNGNKAVLNVNGTTILRSQYSHLFENTRTSGFSADKHQYNVIALRHYSGSGASAAMFLDPANGHETGAVGYGSTTTLPGYIDDAVYLNASPWYDDTGTRTRDYPARLVLGQEYWNGTAMVNRRRMFIGTQPDGYHIDLFATDGDRFVRWDNSNKQSIFRASNGSGGAMTIQNANSGGYSTIDLINSSGSAVASVGWGNSSAGLANVRDKAYLTSTTDWLWYTGGNENLRLTSTGRLGLGTASPAYPFVVGRTGIQAGSSNFYISAGMQDATLSKGIIVGYNNSDNSGIISGSAQDLAFWGYDGAAWNEQVRILKASGRVGFGLTTPTAVVHLKAGTATANTAPLKFTSGTNLTTAEAGAIEYDGTEFYATNSTASRTTIIRGLKGSATLDFPNTTTGNSSDLTISVTGASDGDVVSLGVINALRTITGTDYRAWVSATNTVTIRFINTSGGDIDPASNTFKVTVIK